MLAQIGRRTQEETQRQAQGKSSLGKLLHRLRHSLVPSGRSAYLSTYVRSLVHNSFNFSLVARKMRMHGGNRGFRSAMCPNKPFCVPSNLLLISLCTAFLVLLLFYFFYTILVIMGEEKTVSDINQFALLICLPKLKFLCLFHLKCLCFLFFCLCSVKSSSSKAIVQLVSVSKINSKGEA